MGLLRDIGRFVWAVLSTWQAYMTGGIIIAILGIYERVTQKTISLRVFIVGVLAFLLVAFFMAWRTEYHKASNAEVDLDTLRNANTPRLVAEYDNVYIAPAGPGDQDCLITITGRIKNSGAPSITQDWFEELNVDGVVTRGTIVRYRPGQTITIMGTDKEPIETLDSSRLWPHTSYDDPIPTGGAKAGFIQAVFRGVSSERAIKSNAMVTLVFHDMRGDAVSLEHKLAKTSIDRNNFGIDPDHLQRPDISKNPPKVP